MKKKLLSLVLAVAMLFSLAIPAFADEAEAAAPYTVPADVAGKVVILHTNDVHGADLAESGKAIGDAGVAALKKAFEKAGAEVLLLSAGDATQGAPIVNLSQGEAAIEFMNAAGYSAMVPGNHEFDWGADNFQTIAKKAEFPVLAANIVDEKTGEAIFATSTIFETKAGLKIGVFGLDTPEAATKTNPEKVKGIKFLAGEELYECAEINIQALKDEQCDFIICLGHLGVDEETKAGGNRSVDVVEKVSGIDLFIDGHSHSTTDEIAAVIDNADKSNVLNGTKIVSTGTKLANVGVVVIDPATKAMTDELVPAAAWTEVDEEVASIVNKTNEDVDNALSTIMGKTEVMLDGARDPGVRTQETNLGDFAADAILWFARKNAGGDDKVDVALTNGGGIRASIEVGEISMKTMNTVFPFGNTVATIELTGQQLLEALESATYAAPKALGAFPQVAGVEFTIDTTGEYENGEAYGTYFRCANPGTRVTDVKVGGEPLDLEKTYVLATNDFTAVGGDTYYSFKDVKSTMKDTGIPLDQALSEYTNEVLGGTITAEKYGKPAGRITIKYVGVEPGAWYTDAAKNVIDKGIMNATSAGNFDPNGIVTRGTVFQTLYNLEGKPENVNKMATFPDAQGKWYEDAARWAEANELVNGTGAGLFEGDRAITRAELVVVLERYAKLKGVDTASETNLLTYADGETIAAYSVDAFKWAVGTGMIKGKNGNLLDPAGTAVRAELAQILTNYTAAPWGAAVLLGEASAISKYGNVGTTIPYGNLGVVGITVGDILKVEITGQKAIEIPLGTGYSNVDQGSPLALADTSTNTLALAINRGDFATTYGLGVKGDSGYAITEGKEIKISLAQKGGYLAEMEVRELDSKRTNSRDDYASDEVFANFRPITVGNIAEGVLYRTSSPVNPELGRNAYADKLIENAGVKTIVNLADCRNTIAEYEGFDNTYYAKQNYVCLNMGVDMYAADAIEDLKNGLEFMVENPGPYAFHCTEGKDRAGYYAMLLEALMGATVQDIVADYMLSFENYYFVKADTEQWSKIAASNIEKDLIKLTGAKDIVEAGEADLAAAAEKYMIETIGLTQEQVNTLKTNLSTPIGA